jgi:hypothetical protein
LLETMMGLFHSPVFMRYPSIGPGWLHPVMLHERQVANRPVFSLLFAQVPHGGSQVVGTMLLWDATQLPQGFLDLLTPAHRSVSLKQMLTASTLEYVSTTWYTK